MTAPNTGTSTTATQGGAAGGGSDSAQGAGAAVAARSGSDTTAKRAETSAIAERFLAKFGSYERALEVMAGEAYDYRQAAHKDADTIASLTRNQVPAGALILTGDEKTAWEKIKETGVKPGDIPARIKKAAELEEADAKRERSVGRANAARVAKLDPLVLDPLLDQFKLTVETRKEKVPDGKGGVVDGEVAYVRSATDDKAPWEKLADFTTKDGSPLKPFAAALAAKGGNSATTFGSTSSNGTGTTGTGSQGETVHNFPAMVGGTDTSGGATDAADAFLQRRNAATAKRGNPLVPPQQSSTTGKA